MVLRADKAARAARHNFDTWYSQKVSECPQYRFSIVNSPSNVLRSSCPHSLLYFLIQVLQRLLHQFWPTAHLDPYVKLCRKANGRCPPSIIALLFYYECCELSPSRSVALPAAIKRRVYDSETVTAAARAAQSAGSPTASSSADAAPDKSERDAFRHTFAENVMEHLVWPAVRHGVIRVAPNDTRDNPSWWIDGIVPILNHPEVFSLYYEGGKILAKNSWYHVCEVLSSYEFPPALPRAFFIQKTVQEFLEDAGYRSLFASDEIAATDPPPAKRGRASSGVPNVVAGLTAETPAASAVSCESKFERGRMQLDFARRFAYSELDQHARATLASADMRRAARLRVCMQICQAFDTYQTTNRFSRNLSTPWHLWLNYASPWDTFRR